MEKITANKKVLLSIVTLVLALCLCFCALCVTVVGFADESDTVAPQAADQRIGLSDLMSRHGVDYAIGPTVTEFEKDNIKYNNNYGITSDKYFSYENYLFIDTVDGKKTLHGWKNGILPAELAGVRIRVDGTDGSGQVYIYAQKKYVIVLPDDIEVIGTSNYYYDRYFNRTGYTKPDKTAYTNFSFYWAPTLYPAENWCPRERLGGIYCGANSRLSEISGVATGADVPKDRADTGTSDQATRKKQCDVMRPALYACNNMRFCILPSGVKVNGVEYKLNTIGRYAFGNCSQMRDINIPGNVTTVGDYAFSSCSQLAHITIPANISFGSSVFSGTSNLRDVINHNSKYSKSDFSNVMNYTTNDNGSKLYAIGTKDGDDGTQAFYFCYNTVLGSSKALVTKDGTTANKIVGYSTGWYAIGLAGLEDKEKQTIYEFPTSVTGNSDDPRRKDIVYDYINPDGTAHKNTLSSAITSYDIADNMMSGTWGGNIVISSSVTNIGDNAFNFCHVQYLEIGSGVQNIGYRSFYDNRWQMGTTNCPNGAVAFNNVQYYYMHCNDIKNIGNGAFSNSTAAAGVSATERWFIFDSENAVNKTLFTTTNLTAVYKYEVPIYAVVASADSSVKVNGDMDTLFRHDSDYGSKTVSGNSYTIVYTKRLGGYGDTFVKLKSGRWAEVSSVPSTEYVAPALPTLDGNSKTVWYSGIDYKTVVSDLSSVYPNSPSGGAYCIFTKKISVPDITPAQWTYTEEMDIAANADEYSFNNLLGLDAADYETELVSYVDWLNKSGEPEYVNAAGKYTLHFKMNGKFGEWADAEAAKYNKTVTVAQKAIDLHDIKNIPVFYAKGSSLDSPLLGEGSKLYEYGNAWYTDEKETEASAEATVSNSYIVYTASGISISPKSDWSLYNIVAASNDASTNSGRYTATFNLSVKNANYVFTYDGSSDAFTPHNISFKFTSDYSATIDKGWYIVQPLNWLVDSATGGSGDSSINNQYVLAANALIGMVSSWTYEDDDIQIHIPKLAKGDGQDVLSVTIALNGKELVADRPVAELTKYLNPAMPAGEYDILIHANAVTVTEGESATTYPAFNTAFKVTVKPKQLDTDNICAALTGGDAVNGQRFEFAADGGLHLHDDISDLIDDLNGKLNKNYTTATRDGSNYWLSLGGADFEKYFGLATLEYNLDSLQTSTYFTAEELVGLTGAPKTVGKYVVYYSISAPNYVALGGSGNASRRNYRFTTVIYREISAQSIAEYINGGTYIYNGGNVFATVNYSQYYSTAYKDAGGYINAGDHTVTLTINDKELTRWKNETVGGVALDLEQGTATITYNVQKAENKWLYTPNIVRWTWGEYNPGVNAISATAAFGTQNIAYSVLNAQKQAIVVEVEVDGITKTVSLSDFDTVSDDIVAALGRLSAGKYYLRAKVADTVNYTALSDYDFEFNIAKISNTWDVTPNMTNWQYTKFEEDSNFIVGEPNHLLSGKVVKYGVFTTKPADSSALSDVAGNNIFTDIQSAVDYLVGLTVGEYWLAAYYDGTENYDELFHTTSFRVNKVAGNYWKDDKQPGISGWTYGEYAASLITNGEADFGTAVYTVQTSRQGGAVSGYTELSYARLAEKLGTLGAGSYYLHVTTTETDNYSAATALNIQFEIAKAANAWKNDPTIEGWVYGSPINTSATYETQHANGGITKEFYLARMVNNVWVADESNGAINDISTADAGMYVYVVTAKASANYGELKCVLSFEIQKCANAWKKGKEPTLFYNWLSGEADYTFNVPEAEAHSELMRFNILNMSNGAAKNGLDTQTFLTELAKLTSGTFQVRMYIGDDIIYSSETEENKAALRAYAKNYYYLSSICEIQIAPRVNSFKYEPRISTILYLGDRKSWAAPTAEATLSDSVIVFTYKDAATGELLGTEMPKAAGKYILTATATASFSEPIERSVEFKVMLSPNSWVSAPTIDGWQEDNSPNAPTANATVGSDKIVYTYANVKAPNVILTERPTTEGEYIMYAVLEMEGYETLRAEYRFTIAPAYDTDLLTVAIVLAVIACALAGVVIYFAIRRYKEN